jgi:YesN/AraC family two-component response regulator
MRVLTAKDGEEAVRLFRRHHPEIDAVILDITMPKLDGIETLRELRRLSPAVKVLLASGYSEQTALESWVRGEPCEFLKKPYRAAELKHKLETILNP